MVDKSSSPKVLLEKGRLIDSIQEVLYILLTGYAPVYPVPEQPSLGLAARSEPDPVVWEPLSKQDVMRYQTVLNVHLKLLNKVMPDLKAIEMSDNSDVSRRYTDLELAQRISSVLAAKAPGLAGPQDSPADPNRGSLPRPDSPEWN